LRNLSDGHDKQSLEDALKQVSHDMSQNEQILRREFGNFPKGQVETQLPTFK
jgi:hypothetical protein